MICFRGIVRSIVVVTTVAAICGVGSAVIQHREVEDLVADLSLIDLLDSVRCEVDIEYFTGFEHGGDTVSTNPQHEGCGFESRRIGRPLNWCGPVTSPTRPNTNNHGKYVLRQVVGKDGNTYYSLGKPTSTAWPSGAFESDPLYISFFFRHNRTVLDALAYYDYGVCGVGSTASRYMELRITHGFTGRFLVLYDSAGTLLQTGTTTIATNTWYWIRLMVSSDGDVQVYVDDTLEFDRNGVNVGTFSTPKFTMGGRWDPVGGHGGSAYEQYYDDVVIGSDWMPNDDHFVVYMIPNANGTHYPDGYWSPSGYGEVYERPHNGDITYVAPIIGYAEGAWWTCNLESCSSAGEYTGIVPLIWAIRNMVICADGSFGQYNYCKIRLQLGSDYEDNEDPRLLFNAYLGLTSVFQTNPWTDRPWVPDDLDDIEVGVWAQEDQIFKCTQAGVHVLFGPRPAYDEDQSKVFHNFGR